MPRLFAGLPPLAYAAVLALVSLLLRPPAAPRARRRGAKCLDAYPLAGAPVR